MAQINGTDGNDFLFGTEQGDVIHGREGDDSMRGGGGNDLMLGGEGNDTMIGEEGDDTLIGGAGDDLLAAVGGNDTMIGGEGNDRFDVFNFGAFNQVAVGGEGIDTLVYTGGPSVIDLGAGTLVAASGGTMSLQSIENLDASQGNGPQQVTGSSAGNFIFTGNGNDTINGAEGNDTLFGGPGDDTFVFDALGEANADAVLFEKYTTEVQGFDENDRIALDNDAMAALGAEGDFSADDERFYAAAGATGGAEGDDRVVYDTESGRLYYDADGSGTGEAQLIAILRIGGFDLAASDITVV
jgi:serralysin